MAKKKKRGKGSKIDQVIWTDRYSDQVIWTDRSKGKKAKGPKLKGI